MRSRVSLALQSESFARRLDAAMRLEAGKLRERLLAAVAEEKAAALEAARSEKVSASRRERELDELLISNAEKVREAISKKKARKSKNGEEGEKEAGDGGGKEERLVVVVDGE